MHVTALPDGLRQDFADRGFETRMIVRDHELDAGEPAFAKTQKKVAPTRPALAVSKLDSKDLATAISTAWFVMTPPSRMRS